MKWRIDYSDETGAGDFDPVEYEARDLAEREARERLASADMPWAVRARLFAVTNDGEPADDQSGAVTIRK
jgi:hypothetical protein